VKFGLSEKRQEGKSWLSNGEYNESFVGPRDRIPIGMEVVSEDGSFFVKVMGARNLGCSRYTSLKNNAILSRVVVGLGMEMFIGMSLFTIDLVGMGTIRLLRD